MHCKLKPVIQRPPILFILFGVVMSIAAPSGLFIMHKFFHGNHIRIAEGVKDLELAYIYTGFATAIVFIILGYLLGRKMEIIHKMALHDTLTGLANRRFLMEQLNHIQECSAETQLPFSILILDLDDFKQVNDRFGHLIGDKTLQAVANTIRETIRRTDFPVRYGGEEFIVVCPETDKEKAYSIAERLRQAIEQIPYKELGFEGQQTASIGVLEIPVEYHLQSTQVLLNVDKILYQAKKQGRNCVIMNEINYSLQQSHPAQSGRVHRKEKNKK